MVFPTGPVRTFVVILTSVSASVRPVLMEWLLYAAWSGEGDKVLRTESGIKDLGWTGVIRNVVLMKVLCSSFSVSLPLIKQSFVLPYEFKIHKVWDFVLATR